MRDYQRIVEFLRDFRVSGVQVVTDEVREAAIAYAELCTSANDRLRQCVTLIQQGLRAEAIQLAEVSPNLLDLSAALDLPDPEGWVELCRRADLPIPPPLQSDRATQLNEAYGQDQPLLDLYAAYRRLALSHASVSKRLNIMRKIASADASPFWDRDIRLFENARFKELRVAFAAAMTTRDVSTITSLSGEVRETLWIENVPADLESAAREVEDRLQRVRYNAKQQELLSKLNEAFTARSLVDCKSLLQELKELSITANGAGLADEAAGNVRAVVNWVQQEVQLAARQRSFTEQCAALTQALNMEASAKDLHAAFRALSESGKAPPADLRERYDRAMRSRAWGTRWSYTAAFGGIAITIAVGLWFIYLHHQHAIAHDWASRIQHAADERKFEVARGLIDEQERRDPNVSRDVETIAAKHAVNVLGEKVAHEETTARETLTLMDSASRTAIAASSDKSLPDDWLNAIGMADEALVRFRALDNVKDTEMGNGLRPAAAQLQEQRDTLKGRYENWVLSQVEEISQKLEGGEVEPKAAAIASASANVAAAEKELGALRGNLSRGSAIAANAADAAAARIARIKGAIVRSRQEWDSRQALAGAAGSAASARQAIQKFIARYPSSSLKDDFAKAVTTIDLYEQAERWNVLAAPWASDPAPTNEKSATQRADVLKAFMHDCPRCPFLPAAAAYAEYLHQATDAMTSPNTWQHQMSEVLAAPLIADLAYLNTSDRIRFYVMADTVVRKQTLGDRVRFTFDTIDPQNLAIRRPIFVVSPQGLLTETPQLTPHTVFARNLLEQMKTIDDRNWDTWGIDSIDRLVADERIEPVVKGILLRELLQATAKADGWALNGLYDRSIDGLVRQQLDLINWYDMNHPVSAVTLASLKSIIAAVPKREATRKLLAARRTELFHSLGSAYSGMGMLLQDDDGRWQIVTPPGYRPAQVAMAILPPPPDPIPAAPAADAATSQPATPDIVPAKLIKVARRDANGFVVDESAVRMLPQGTLVFLMQQ